MKVWERVLDLLFPPKCPFCQKILDDPRAPLCPGCQGKLPWLEGRAGERRIDFADGCWSPLAYDGLVRSAVHHYKFHRVRALGDPLAVLMAQCLAGRLPQGADLICWAPLSKERFRQRGFNQAELLAREIGRMLSIPAEPLLEKVKDTGPQGQRPGSLRPAARRQPDGQARGAGGRRGYHRLHPQRAVRPSAAGGGGGGVLPHPGPGQRRWASKRVPEKTGKLLEKMVENP